MSGAALSLAVVGGGATGYHGKLPARGDFLTRRLPAGFVDPWHGFLEAGLASARDRLGAAFTDTYLVAPIWRFSLAPGVVGAEPVVGTLMASADRVGRLFPITLAATAPPGAGTVAALALAEPWFAAAEAVVLDHLDADADLDRFEAACAALAGPAAGPVDGLARLLADRLDRTGDAAAMWWTEGTPDVPARLESGPGLPPPDGFHRFLIPGEGAS